MIQRFRRSSTDTADATRASDTRDTRSRSSGAYASAAESALDPEMLHRTRESFLTPTSSRFHPLFNIPTLLGAAVTVSTLYLMARYLFSVALGLQIPISVLEFSDSLPVFSGLALLLAVVFTVLRRPGRRRRRSGRFSRSAAAPAAPDAYDQTTHRTRTSSHSTMSSSRRPTDDRSTYDRSTDDRFRADEGADSYDPLDAFLNRTGRARDTLGSTAARDGLDPYAINRKKRLFRSRRDVRLFGVCGGLAQYFGINSTFVRLGFILGMLSWGTTLVVYLVLLLLMRKEPVEWMRFDTSDPKGRR